MKSFRPDEASSHEVSAPTKQTISRRREGDPYIICSSEWMRDPALTNRARGLLAWMLDHPTDWRFHVSQMASELREGEHAIRTDLSALFDAGYVVRHDTREAGQFGGATYYVFAYSADEADVVDRLERGISAVDDASHPHGKPTSTASQLPACGETGRGRPGRGGSPTTKNGGNPRTEVTQERKPPREDRPPEKRSNVVGKPTSAQSSRSVGQVSRNESETVAVVNAPATPRAAMEARQPREQPEPTRNDETTVENDPPVKARPHLAPDHHGREPTPNAERVDLAAFLKAWSEEFGDGPSSVRYQTLPNCWQERVLWIWQHWSTTELRMAFGITRDAVPRKPWFYFCALLEKIAAGTFGDERSPGAKTKGGKLDVTKIANPLDGIPPDDRMTQIRWLEHWCPRWEEHKPWDEKRIPLRMILQYAMTFAASRAEVKDLKWMSEAVPPMFERGLLDERWWQLPKIDGGGADE